MTTQGPREFQELFEGLLQSAPFGIAVFDPELRFVEINPRLAAMNGQSREAHLGRRLSEIVKPDPSTDRVIECLRHVLQTGQSVTGEEITYVEPRPSHREIVCLASYHPLRRDGRVVGVYAFVEDITARRQAERERNELLARERAARERAEAVAQALGESEARHRAILAALDEGIVVQDKAGEIVTGNASAERILGLSFDQMTGRTSMDPRWQAIHEDGSPFPGQDHPAMVALRTGEPLRAVIMGVHRPDGSRVWLSINAQPLHRPGDVSPNLVVTSFFDVTGFKLALQATHMSEQRFRSLVEATTQMVWTADAQGRVKEDSPSWRAYTGRSLQELLGDQGQQAIHPDDWERSVACWQEALARKEPLRLEQRVRGHDGQYRLFQVRAVPVRAEDGSVREWIGTHTDISAARQAEQERARLLREAQEAVRVRDEFLTVAAHELRTPLTSLRLHLQLLLRQLDRGNPELAARLSPRCESMERQISRLVGLISMLLDVSRLTTERLILEPQQVDLAQMVLQLADTFAGEFHRAGAELHVRGADEPLVGQWDALRLEQIVVNLLSNALRYGLGRPVEVLLGREGSSALLRVRDQGIGISEEDLARIFDKFERAVSDRNYGGLGLGLYITRQIVDAMGGSIEVVSRPGEGSTFTVRLPMEPPAAHQGTARS